MEKNFSESAPIRATLRTMEVGDIVHFPTPKVSVIRSTCTTLGLEMERRYSAKLNRPNKTIDVTRLS